MKVEYSEEFKKDCKRLFSTDWYWAIYRFVKDIPWKFRQLKYFFIRGYRGWSAEDTWSMDNHLNRIIPEMLEHLAGNSMGCPDRFFDHGMDDNQCWRWKEFLKEQAKEIRMMNEIHEMSSDAWHDKHISINEMININEIHYDRGIEAYKKLLEHWGSLWD